MKEKIENKIISFGLVILGIISFIYGAIWISMGDAILGNALMITGFNFFIALLICSYIKYLFREEIEK